MKMNLEVEPIDDRYSGYQYLLNVGGARIPCFATYDLREKSADRGLFLVNESDASVLLSRLTVADLASLEQVKQALVTKARHTPSAIEQVKSVVNDIYDDRVALSSASVAVHKFGPVVVSVIDSALRAECRGRQIRGRIAIYPDQVLRKSRGHRPSEMKSRAEFVRSLHEDLPRILQAYFEEIGELLYDIQHHRTQDEGVAKARNAQAVLSRSVGSKLDAILKVSPRLNKFDARATTAAANEIRDDYPDWIVTAAYTQAFIGWALAGYWQTLGFSADVKAAERKVAALFNAAPRWLVERCPEMIALNNGALPAFTKAPSAYNIILRRQSTYQWVNDLLGFVAYVDFLREKNVPCNRPRCFFSAHYRHPLSGMMQGHIQAHAKNTSGTAVYPELLNVTRRGDEARVDFVVRNTIGMSDTCVALIPAKPEDTEDPALHNYQWIAREVEHALLLKHPVFPMVQRAHDPVRLRRDIEATHQFLAPHAIGTDRMKKVADVFTNQGRVDLDPGETTELDPRLAKPLDAHFREALERRAETLVRSAMERLPELTQYVVARIDDSAIHPKTKSQLARRVGRDHDRALPAVRRAIRRAERECLCIDGEEYPLVAPSGRNKHVSGVEPLLRAVLPKASGDEISGLKRRILARYQKPGYIEDWRI